MATLFQAAATQIVLVATLVALVVAQTVAPVAPAAHRNMPSNMRRVALLVTLLLVLGVLGVFLHAKNSLSIGAKYSRSGTNTPTATLVRQNQAFATGQKYQTQGDYALALQYYQKALPVAQDSIQRAQIQFDIAFMNEVMGNYVQAIGLYKQIVADTSNYTLVRAYSVERIAIMYTTYVDAQSSILKATFTGLPYSSFKQGNNIPLAYRYLFEYAVSIYPLGISESKIARWYSDYIIKNLHGATTTLEAVSDLSIITRSIQKADADIEKTKNDPVAAQLIPGILVQEGVALGNLATVGAADPLEAEKRFQQALQFNATTGIKPGTFDAYLYANFLATQYGEKRSSDITQILSAFKVGNDSNIYPVVATFYRAAADGPKLTGSRKQMILLGQIDPDFKAYLISLGWHEADFKKTGT